MEFSVHLRKLLRSTVQATYLVATLPVICSRCLRMGAWQWVGAVP